MEHTCSSQVWLIAEDEIRVSLTVKQNTSCIVDVSATCLS